MGWRSHRNPRAANSRRSRSRALSGGNEGLCAAVAVGPPNKSGGFERFAAALLPGGQLPQQGGPALSRVKGVESPGVDQATGLRLFGSHPLQKIGQTAVRCAFSTVNDPLLRCRSRYRLPITGRPGRRIAAALPANVGRLTSGGRIVRPMRRASDT